VNSTVSNGDKDTLDWFNKDGLALGRSNSGRLWWPGYGDWTGKVIGKWLDEVCLVAR